MKECALIVAGGKGLRFGSQLPKQFVELNGRPVLMRTLDAFFRYSPEIDVVLVLPEHEISEWQSLAQKHNFSRHVRVVTGGLTRFQSVRNGLAEIPDEALVAIHDGVRPLVPTAVIGESFRVAALRQSAIACVSLKESLRLVTAQSGDHIGSSQAVSRSQYRLVQTPQTFHAALIKKAYCIREDPGLTDDASVAERAGYELAIFEGSYENIKITGPEDLIIAGALHRANLGM